MTPRERLLAAIHGEETDRPAFSPFLAYYWESLPSAVQEKGALEYLESMGADPLLRGHGCAWEVRTPGSTVVETEHGGKRRQTIANAKGELTMEWTHVAAADTWFLTTHPVKTVADLETMRAHFDAMEVVPAREALDAELAELGERALALPLVGIESKSCFQSMIEHWVGTEELTYLLYDEPEEVEATLQAMQRRAFETVEIAAGTRADGFIFWDDTSTTNQSPAFYDRYVVPEVTRWAGCLAASGKFLVQHACGHLRDLLPAMARQGIAAVESLSPPPTGNVTVREALALLPREIALIGGLEPTFLLYEPVEAVLDEVDRLLEMNRGRRFVLANSDSCPPGVSYDKFTAIVERVRDFR
jgi:hypothetical protein